MMTSGADALRLQRDRAIIALHPSNRIRRRPMSQPFRPSIESLNTRTLLAGFVIPPEPLVPFSSPLIASLSLSKVGSTEALTLTETNASGNDTNVAIGCGVANFWVTQAGVEVWRQSK